MECQYDQTTYPRIEVNIEYWFTLHLATYLKVMLLQRVSPVNWLAKCLLMFLNNSSEPTHEVEQFQGDRSRSYQKEMSANNGESKMPILCFRVRATQIIIATRRSQVL